jgi:hypothetical protein
MKKKEKKKKEKKKIEDLKDAKWWWPLNFGLIIVNIG